MSHVEKPQKVRVLKKRSAIFGPARKIVKRALNRPNQAIYGSFFN